MLSTRKIEIIEAVIASEKEVRPHTVIISEKTGMQKPNVQRYLDVLEKAGILERQFTFKVNYTKYNKALLADKVVASLHINKSKK